MTSNAHDNNASIDASTAADLDTAIKVTVTPVDGLGGINALNLVRSAVTLTNLTTGKIYQSSDPGSELRRVKTSGGGDVLIVQTNDPLVANCIYQLEVNGTNVGFSSKVKDVQGNVFARFVGTFTTGSYLPPSDPTINFNQYAQAAPGNKPFIATTIGPDHRLYASTSDGFIYRYDIDRDGTLSNEFPIDTIRTENGNQPRIITGITFDPGSFKTGAPLALWVSHNQFRFGNYPDGSHGDSQRYADNFTGKISVISGPALESYQDRIINIPRSVKDHMNNQMVFSPNGKILYFGVAGLNAMGDVDSTWGGRVENIYSASIMQLRLGSGPTGYNTYFRARGAVNLKIDGDQNTADGLTTGTTHYNIFKGTNPLRLYATGIRNAFDLTFDRNGHLLANVNGSSAGGNVPATPPFGSVPVAYRPDKTLGADGNYVPYAGPASPALKEVLQTEEDSLIRVVEGKYYGHPNPSRGEYIFDGGNPTAGTDNDPFEIAAYPDGQKPDRNYEYPVYDYGTNFSPDGILQYTSVGGVNKNLDGYLLSARYSGGSDILALKPNADGTIDTAATKERIKGFTGQVLGSPLDMVEDMTNGNIYVVSLETEIGPGSIILLKPTKSAGLPDASVSPTKLAYYVKPGAKAVTRTVTITNNGTADLVLDPSASRIGGAGRGNFVFGKGFPTAPTTIPAGTSIAINILGYLAAGQTSTAAATLSLKTNDADTPYLSVALRAVSKTAT